ncbi:MAG: hypothetical protein ACRDRV_12580 [Pseudonocardiaceae bacterium]
MILTTRPRRDPRPPRNPTQRRARRDRDRYRREQARLDAEAVSRWQAIVADWPPLSEGQIRVIADILRRIDTHTTPSNTTTTRKERNKRGSYPSR